MRRFLLLCVAAGIAGACSPYAAIHKRPEEFIKLCESVNPGATPVAETNETDTAKLKPRLVSPGMQVSIAIAEDTSLNRTYLISPGCAIDFPAPSIGRISVCGLTTDELAEKIRQPLERDYFQKATVTVTIESATSPERTGGVVYLIGDINHPGPLLLPRDEVFTLTKAIIAAGGFSQFSKSTAVRVLRYCEDGKKYDTFINVERIMKKGEFERDVPLRPNDWIIVGQKFIVGSSRVDLQACKLEYSIVSPK